MTMPKAIVMAVIQRDLDRVWQFFCGDLGMALAWRGDRLVTQTQQTVICPAVLIDRSEFGKCWGRWTMDHVNHSPMRGKRAPHDLAHVISLCEGHTEPGMKAGFIWNTANRPAIRTYLGEANGA